MPNSVIYIRGLAAPSITSEDCAPTLGSCGIPHSHPSPESVPTPLGKKVDLSGRTLDRRSNLSEDISIITLPSFVEHERLNLTSSPILAPQNLPTVEDMGSLQASTRFPLFQSSRSRERLAITMSPTTPSSEGHLVDGFLNPPLPAPDRQLYLPHQAHSPSSRQAGVRRELATAKLESVAQAEAVKIAQPGAPETLKRSETNHSCVLSPLKIPAHTLSFLGDYDSIPTDDKLTFHEERDTGVVFHDFPRLVPLRIPVELKGAPLSLSVNDPTEPSSSYQPPILSSFNSPTPDSNPDERRSRVISQARSSISTAPSPSAFPSPPDFLPGPRDKALPIASRYSTSGRTFPSVKLWEGNFARSIETTSSNEGQTSISFPDADASRRTSTIDSRPVLSRHLHPKFMERGDMSVRLGASSRTLSVCRLPRTPSGPRQISVNKQIAP